MFKTLKTLKTITYEQAKQHILPDDVFFEQDKKEYWKVKHIYKGMVVAISVLFILMMLLIQFLNNYKGDFINKKSTILSPFLPYICWIIYSLSIVLMIYFWYMFNKTDIYGRFYQKKYMLLKNLSINMVIVSMGVFLMVFYITIEAPLGGINIAFVLLIIFLTLNYIIITSNFSSEIGQFCIGFKKNKLQKITGNLIPFLGGNILVFYVIYKVVWTVFPDVIHGLGDSALGSDIGAVGIPLIFSVFPIYYMGEKIVKGYLVNKYYDQFKVDYDLKE